MGEEKEKVGVKAKKRGLGVGGKVKGKKKTKEKDSGRAPAGSHPQFIKIFARETKMGNQCIDQNSLKGI